MRGIATPPTMPGDPLGYPGTGFGLGFAVLHDPAVAGVVGTPGEVHWGGAFSTSFWVTPASRDTEQAEDRATRVERLLQLGRHELLWERGSVGHVGQQGHPTLAEGRLSSDGHGHIE
jgi:hypothetical protein